MKAKNIFNLNDAGTSVNVELYEIPTEASKYLFTMQSDDYQEPEVKMVLNRKEMQGLLSALADSMNNTNNSSNRSNE